MMISKQIFDWHFENTKKGPILLDNINKSINIPKDKTGQLI